MSKKVKVLMQETVQLEIEVKEGQTLEQAVAEFDSLLNEGNIEFDNDDIIKRTYRVGYVKDKTVTIADDFINFKKAKVD